MTEPAGPTAGRGDRVSVVLIDDHAIWRDGVRSVLDGSEFAVVGEAASPDEALPVVTRTKPQIVLLDIRLGGGNGLETLVALKKAFPRLVVIMLTTYDDPTFLARAVVGGASGYLLKGLDADELIGALRAVAAREMLLSPTALAQSLQQVTSQDKSTPELAEPLTDREIEVLKLLTGGLSNREIAEALFIADSTAKTHVEHIIRKLGVSDRVQAAVWAVQHGLVSPSA